MPNDTSSASTAALPATAAPGSAGAATPRQLERMLSLEDFEPAARGFLPRPIYGYVSGGSETNASLRGNRSAYDEYSLVPRVLIDTTPRTTRRTLFGKTYDAPFGLAPMGGTSLAAYEGDVVFARTAAACRIPMIQSGASLTPMEEIPAVNPDAWFQAYLPGDMAIITPVVQRAADAGFQTLVVTVDVPVMSNRENNVRNGYSTPLRPSLRLAWDCAIRPRWLFGTFLRTCMNRGLPHLENMGNQRLPILSSTAQRIRHRRDQLNWTHIEEMRRLWKGRLVLKGVLDPQDAKIARESGVDAVMVSNHGGRQLDGAVAPLRALPGVAAAAGNMTVILDGGVRRGTDLMKALALGAQFVFIGRPFLYAAAIGGAPGLQHAIRLLREEVERNMALIGITDLKDMTRERLVAARGPVGLE